MSKEKVAFLFPGQGSQWHGMGVALADRYKEARDTFNDISEMSGKDILNLCKNNPENKLFQDTRSIQLAVFAVSVAAYVVYRQRKKMEEDVDAGHSLGEVTGILASGNTDLETATSLVVDRGEAMDEAGRLTPGGMIVMDRHPEEVVERAISGTTAKIANINSRVPGREQYVVSGSAASIETVEEFMEGDRRTFRLPIPIPAHAPEMAHAYDVLKGRVESSKNRFRDGARAIVPNRKPGLSSSGLNNARQIYEQMTHGVDFSGGVSFMIEQLGIRHFVELGPGNVLSGLVRRHIKDRDDVTVETFGDKTDIT